MHHYSIRPFYHIRATVNAKHATVLHCRYNGAKVRTEREESCGKSHHDGLTMLCK